MSWSGERYRFPRESQGILWVTQCGLTRNSPGHTVPKMTYKAFSIHFILAGCGTYSVCGKTQKVRAGEGFMIFPDEPCSYCADENDPWQYIYVTFSGAGDLRICHTLGLDESDAVFSFASDRQVITEELYVLMRDAAAPDATGFSVLGRFLLVIGHLSRLCEHRTFPDDSAARYVRLAVCYLQDNYQTKVSIQDVADHIGIDKAYLHRIFRRITGVSPARYLVTYRIGLAKELMSCEDLSLTDVALSVGFYDVSHFSRVFRRETGFTPSTYLLQVRNKGERFS